MNFMHIIWTNNDCIILLQGNLKRVFGKDTRLFKMKIALIGELYSCNLGEPLLFDCCEYAVKEIDDAIEIDKIDFFGRKCKQDKITSNQGIPVLYQSIRILRKLFAMFQLPMKVLDEWKWAFSYDNKYLRKFYEEKLIQGGYDGIIIMGAGTLKYDVRLNFAPYYKILIETAESLQIPVYINCVGVESKYRAEDRRCRMFEDALNRDIVKVITTRDDIDELKKYVKNKKTNLAKIADIGTWAAETYQIEKKKNAEYVGLGVITPERFREFGRLEIYKKYQKFWVDLISALDREQIKWKIFNNGDTGDREFAEKLCRLAGKPVAGYVLTPQNPRELVQIVSEFNGIISSRLHSCIVAYSLKVPFVAISWNNKLQYFAREILVPDRVIEENELQVETVLEKFRRAKEEGYDTRFYELFRRTSKDYMNIYIQSMRKEEKKG